MIDSLKHYEECSREPIHASGGIQPHGLLFVLSNPDLSIVQVSANCEQHLGLTASELIARGLSSFLATDQIERIHFALKSGAPDDQNPVTLGLKSIVTDVSFDGVVHSHDGVPMLELEMIEPNRKIRFLEFFRLVSSVTSALQTSSSLTVLTTEAAEGIRQVTGFDRVMIYRFASNGDGEVIAESKAPSLEPYLMQWYPASDIPAQARRLYLISRIRLIPDASYRPVPLIPRVNPNTGQDADLSFATLRSVSPIHCEYLSNMGVKASMSVSIICNGELWGLIACHHSVPHAVPYENRKACLFLGHILSGEIARRESEAESLYLTHASWVLASLFEKISDSPNLRVGLTSASASLLDLIPCHGVSVIEDEAVANIGACPDTEAVWELTVALAKAEFTDLFVTQCLVNHFPAMQRVKDTASGLIALEVSRSRRVFVCFYRPEIVQTLTWGGNPNDRGYPAGEEVSSIRPRRSFAQWKEELSCSALPWTSSEIKIAKELKTLIDIALIKAEV